jgi:glycolate oxidase FAD binding subunit
VSGDSEVLLQEKVLAAKQLSTPLAITGGGSKAFYGREIVGESLSITDHSGVIDYHPTELVITARAGTPLREITKLLDENNQMLGFEPPEFSESATLGGVIATGLSGPARPFLGPAHHFVLGVKILNGHGQVLQFGGRVIKNVAGFDVSRLMVGALGCLGILLEISLKVVPKPASELTMVLDHADAEDGVILMNSLAGKPTPISAAAWVDGKTRIRLSGSKAGVKAAVALIDADVDPLGTDFWADVRNQTHTFFASKQLLLRGSVAPATSWFCRDRSQLIDWGGGVRWFSCAAPAGNHEEEIESAVQAAGGHLMRFRNGDRAGEVFAQLPATIMKFNQRLKNEFDPERILNRGRMYKNF